MNSKKTTNNIAVYSATHLVMDMTCGLCFIIVFLFSLFSSHTYLAVVKRLFFGAGLDEEFIRQSSVLCAVTIAVSGNPACLPVSIKRGLQTCV